MHPCSKVSLCLFGQPNTSYRHLNRPDSFTRCCALGLRDWLVVSNALSLYAEFGGFKGVVLSHGVFGVVEAVEDEVPEEPESDLALEFHALFAVVVDEDEDILGLGGVGDVTVLTEFDGAVGADDEGASVAPSLESIRCEPVDAEVHGGAVVGDEGGVAVVLEFGEFWVIEVGDTGALDRGVSSVGVGEELLNLVATNVAEDPTVLCLAVEPVGSFLGRPKSVGPESGDVDDPADGAVTDEVGGVHGALDVESFREVDHVLLTGGADCVTDLIELFERGEGRLVGEVVLSGVHAADAEGGAFGGDGGCGNELDVGVVEDVVEGVDEGCAALLC